MLWVCILVNFINVCLIVSVMEYQTSNGDAYFVGDMSTSYGLGSSVAYGSGSTRKSKCPTDGHCTTCTKLCMDFS